MMGEYRLDKYEVIKVKDNEWEKVIVSKDSELEDNENGGNQYEDMS